MLSSAIKGGNVVLGYVIMVIVLLAGVTISMFESGDYLNTLTSIKGVNIFLSSGLTIASALFLNRFLLNYKFITLGNIAPGFFLLLFLTGLPNQVDEIKVLLSVFLLIWMIRKMISLHNVKHTYFPVFEIGVLFGVITLITPQLTAVSALFLIGLTLVKPFTWRDFIIPVLGFLFVILVGLTFQFFTDQDFSIVQIFHFEIHQPTLKAKLNLTQIVISGITAIEFVFIFKLFAVIEKKNIRQRVHYWLWIWLSIFLLVSLLFLQSPINKVELILIMGLPISVFSVEFLESSIKTWQKELILFLLIAMIFYIRIEPMLNL